MKKRSTNNNVKKNVSVVATTLLIMTGLVLALARFQIGELRLLSVVSGSMEPAIHLGSVIAVKPSESYQVGEIITISEPANPGTSLTHRLAEIKDTELGKYYITKGDANESVDSEPWPESSVVGRVVMTIPYLGLIAGFAKTLPGLIILMIIPSVIIIFLELQTINREVLKLRKIKQRTLAAICMGILLLGQNLERTGAYLSVTKQTSAEVSAGVWQPRSELDLYWQRAGQKLAFKHYGTEIPLFTSFDYEITYPTDHGVQKLLGSRAIKGASEIVVDNLVPGICTTGGTCVYDEITGTIKLKVIFHGVVDRTLETSL